jgi:VWFA-related protein
MQRLFPQSRALSLLSMAALLFFCSGLLGQHSQQQQPAPPLTNAQFQQTPPPATSPATPAQADSLAGSQAPSSRVPSENAELSSHDSPATFKVRVNLVLVRVVVRDSQGKIVPNLRREDFQLFDNRKPQAISSFNVETPESQALRVTSASTAESPVAGDSVESTAAAAAKKLPQRFVAVFFDDVHLSMEDSVFVRSAANKILGALAPSDRVGVYTSSGQFQQPFTADHELLTKSLYAIVPHPLTGTGGIHDCPDISYYQADLIANKNDSQALAVAAEDAVQCAFNGNEAQVAMAQQLAQTTAYRTLSMGDQQTEFAYRHLEEGIRQLSVMPGQRVMVFVSPGFIPSTLQLETSDLVDRASRAGIVINTIDARGLYTPDLFGDIADPSHDSMRTSGYKATYRVAAQFAQNEVMEELAHGTGGTFFHNRNDVDEGLRQAIAAPPLSYVLGFSPQNMKVDGRFHALKVTLTNKQKYAIQARNGYYAPKTVPDPAEAAKQEIREAIFSQEEMHDVPVDLQTQFFKMDPSSARLSVVTHFDLKGIHFRKSAGRNADQLIIATAIFDENGNFVIGGEKTVQMKLLDSTYDRLSRSGLTLKSSYDVKPGSYLVRLVVRDGEGSQMAARNGAVVIPN